MDLKLLQPCALKRISRSFLNKTKAVICRPFNEKRTRIGYTINSWRRLWVEIWHKNIYSTQPLNRVKPISARHAGPDAPGTAIRWVGGIEVSGISKTALFAHAPSRVVFRMTVPRRARLRVFISLLPSAWEVNQDGVNFRMEVSSAGADPQVVFTRNVQPKRHSIHRRWVEVIVSLKQYAELEIDLIFVTDAIGEGSTNYAWALWGEPQLVVRKSSREIRLFINRLLVSYGAVGALIRSINVLRQSSRSGVTKLSLPTGAPPLGGNGAGILHQLSPRLNSCRTFAIYTNSKGNYFFNEIRDLLAVGLEEAGFNVLIENETVGFASRADWHIVVAPHEFFYLGAGEQFRENNLPHNLILLNTEQPSTEWFARAYPFFSKSHVVWDINHFSSEHLKTLGILCSYLPLGYVPGFQLYKEHQELPINYGTCFLEPEIVQRSYLNEPLANRPIDILFLGYLSSRRDNFFADAASVLSKYRCYFYFWDAQAPIISGENSYMNTATAVGLAQRSKIMLNIHHGQDAYFEWHRVVMHGLGQKTLVISENSEIAPPFEAGRDFVTAPFTEIAEEIVFYLSSSEGQRRAQTIVDQGFQTLTEKCRLSDTLRDLILQLYIPYSNVKFWNRQHEHHASSCEVTVSSS